MANQSRSDKTERGIVNVGIIELKEIVVNSVVKIEKW